jgi:hypothetical protein
MAVTLQSISGGVLDPYNGEGSIPIEYQFPRCARDGDTFIDVINVVPDVGSTNIISANIIVTYNNNVITPNLITSGNVTLNFEYQPPGPSDLSSSISYTVNNLGTTANILITGTIISPFNDRFWRYRNFTNDEDIQVLSNTQIPDDDVGLFLFKPSMLRYVSVYYTVAIQYDIGNETITAEKRVINDWEADRLALLSQIQRENTYRENNYGSGV